MEWETNDIYGKCWKKINRENFVSSEQQLFSHVNKPIPIKENQTTSQPTLITFMIEKL
jgi:protein-L-isoaspartate O-methyltransferase